MTATDVARGVIERLLGLGVREAVLAPGSRSGPLALALHAADTQGLVRLHVRVDEREAGFLALGLAKVSGRPVPVLTTSGTAVANLHPAMLEALHAQVPVIAVTADRPARLRGTGANQTTDQVRIFAGVPFLASADDLRPTQGPVQLNVELDQPLIEPLAWQFSASAPSPGRAPDPAPPAVLTGSARTVVVAGDGAGPRARRIAEEGCWPLLAEPSSGVRGASAIGTGRLLLAELGPRVERVVSVGHATLSRPVTALLTDPDVDVVHLGDLTTFPGAATPLLRFAADVEVAEPGDPAWLAEWTRADARARVAVDALGLDSQRLAQAVWAAAAGGVLTIGSSSVVRDLDLVTPGPAPELVVANRGLAGIDGMVSTAVGAALAADRPSHLVVGDLTFLHGANGLLIGPAEPRPDLTIVVAADDGGAIFAGLEQGAPEYGAAFERVYATPTGTDLAALCRAHGVAHRRVRVRDLAAALAAPPSGLAVIEVPLDRTSRRADAARVASAVRSAI